MSRFTIGIVGRETNRHAACFEDFTTALADALRTLGHEVTGFDNPGRLIMFGANNVVDPDNKIPSDAIVFNTEQVASTGVRAQMTNYEQFKKFTVWDYSKSNIEEFRKVGIEAVHCPVGYMPSMTKHWPETFQDIDVLFYGAVNERRQKILDEVVASGLNVKVVCAYGADRDNFIRRSKIVLNLHFFENAVFEIFRCSHLFANRKCVVSESGGQDAELEELANRATLLVSKEYIADECVVLVRKDEKYRGFFADDGFEAFEKTSLIESVEYAISKS